MGVLGPSAGELEMTATEGFTVKKAEFESRVFS